MTDKKELAEQILRKHIAWDCSDSDIEYYKQLNGRIWNGAIAAIIEAMGKPEDDCSHPYDSLMFYDGTVNCTKCLKEDLDSKPQSVEAMGAKPEANWKQLRDKFFKECTETYEVGKGLNVLRKVSYNIAPHDLFEWFKKELQSPIEAMGVQPGIEKRPINKQEKDELLQLIRNLLAEPYGCPMCDCGKLRNPNKQHWDDCHYLKANHLLNNEQNVQVSDTRNDAQ